MQMVVKNWILPPGVFLICKKLINAMTCQISIDEQKILNRNQVFKDKHKGKRCFVIGNGPSLKYQDLSLLTDELTFVVSGFWKHPIVAQWQPSYYFFADPLFFDDSEPMDKFFSDLRLRIHSTIFFVPLDGIDAINKGSLLPTDFTYYLKFAGNLVVNNLQQLEFTKTVPALQSVSQMAIMGAMYMGCTEIYLLGLDHDWLAQRGMDRHFYEGKTIENHSVAHGNLDLCSYKSDLESGLNLWKGYENILQLADTMNIKIMNATHGGFLDVFPRRKYEELFL